MTTSHTPEQDERAQFETWASKRGMELHKVAPCDGSAPYYQTSEAKAAFAAWQASRAAQPAHPAAAVAWMWIENEGICGSPITCYADAPPGRISGATPLFLGGTVPTAAHSDSIDEAFEAEMSRRGLHRAVRREDGGFMFTRDEDRFFGFQAGYNTPQPSDDTALLRQALYAIEATFHQASSDGRPKDWGQLRSAMSAIRARLATPAAPKETP